MVGTILDFTPYNVLNVGTNQVQYKSKTQKKIITWTKKKNAAITWELFLCTCIFILDWPL